LLEEDVRCYGKIGEILSENYIPIIYVILDVTTVLHSVLCPGMFDRDRSGSIDVNEFQQLYNYINQWLAAFRTYDRDGSGYIEEPELNQGIVLLANMF
jgi:hypothetical protein